MKKVQSAKKLFAMLIALVMVFSVFSVSVFAAEQDNLNPSSGDVLVKYDDGGHPATYSVDITWGAMKFDYKANEVWNPETHKWEVDLDNTYCEPVGDSNIITVANHSSVPVDAEFSFESLSEYGEFGWDFSCDDPGFYRDVIDLPVPQEDAEAKKVNVSLELYGDVDSSLEDYTKVGTVTVTLSEHTGLYFELINNDAEYALRDVRMDGETQLTVPAEYNGKPVTSILDCGYDYNITEVILPNTIKTIGEDAFYGLKIESIVIPESVETIGARAFAACSMLKSIEIPSGVEELGFYTFTGCTSLENVTLHEGLELIGQCAFENCKNLKTIEIPSSVKEIGYMAFNRCPSLETVILHEGLETISARVFEDCENLKGVNFPASLKQIDTSTFRFSPNVTTITVDGANPVYHSDGNCLIETATKTLVAACPNSVIPDDGSVTRIGDGAFAGCNGITNLVLNEHITEIGFRAFERLETLINITFLNSTVTVENSAFQTCYSLTTITIPSTANIAEDAFESDGSFYVIKTDDASAFTFGSTDKSGIANNTKVIIDGNGTNYKIEEDGTTYFMNGDFLYSVKDEEYKLIAYIGKNADVTFPETVNSKPYTLYEVKGVVNVTFPANLTKIEDRAFFSSRGISQITIPSGVQSIGNSAFERCRNMESIDIPISVTAFGDRAFNMCNMISEINYEGTKEQWNAITKGTYWEPDSDHTIHCSDGDIEVDNW